MVVGYKIPEAKGHGNSVKMAEEMANGERLED